MKNSMKPMMAMKSTKVVIKPAAKMAMKKTMMAKSDNTKVVKPVIKEIIKSKFLKAKKK
jgi:hypothetical protein